MAVDAFSQTAVHKEKNTTRTLGLLGGILKDGPVEKMSAAGSLCEQLGHSYHKSDNLFFFFLFIYFFLLFCKKSTRADISREDVLQKQQASGLWLGSRCGNVVRDRESRLQSLLSSKMS